MPTTRLADDRIVNVPLTTTDAAMAMACIDLAESVEADVPDSAPAYRALRATFRQAFCDADRAAAQTTPSVESAPETLVTLKPPTDYLLTCAFIAAGFRSSPDHSEAVRAAEDSGYLPLMADVIAPAKALAAVIESFTDNGIDASGVFDYEVSEELGLWMAARAAADGPLPDWNDIEVRAVDLTLDMQRTPPALPEEAETIRRLYKAAFIMYGVGS